MKKHEQKIRQPKKKHRAADRMHDEIGIDNVQELPEWQRTGYHLQDLPCDRMMPVSVLDEDDSPLEDYPDVPPDLDIDPLVPGGVDESLAELRADSVKNRSGHFWDQVMQFSQKLKPVPEEVTGEHAQPMRSGPQQTVQTRAGGHAGLITVLLLAVIVVVAWLVCSTVFSIQSITVVGNERISAQSIIEASGLRVGDSLLSIDDAKVAAGVTSNRYLKLRNVVHNTTDVELHVIEREPVAYTVVRGYYYTLDGQGMVLEKDVNDAKLGGLIQVDRLNEKDCVLGKATNFGNDEAAKAYHDVVLEIKVMSLLGVVSRLYLDQLDSVALETRDGMYVRLGSLENIHGKLRAMTMTRNKVMSMGYSGGVIDVSNRAAPTYSAPAEQATFTWAAGD